MFQGRLVCVTCALLFDASWRRNARSRNAPFTQRTFRRSSPSASPVRCRNGPGHPVVASGAIRRSPPPADVPGVRTPAAGLGNASTSGGSPGRRRNAARDIAAFDPAVRRRGVTARSTTSLLATGTAMDLGVIITSCRTQAETEDSRCCAEHTTPRSPRPKPPLAPKHDEPPSWPTKLRSSRGVSRRRRLGLLHLRAPSLGPPRCSRSLAHPTRHARATRPPSTSRGLDAWRRHLGTARWCA